MSNLPKIPKTKSSLALKNLDSRNQERKKKEAPKCLKLLIPEVNLNNPEGEKVATIAVEVRPIPSLEKGGSVGILKLDDKPTTKMIRMAYEVKNSCEKLPDSEKPREILEIMKKHVGYAYPEVLKKLTQEEKEVISKKAGVGQINISQIVEIGYGVCCHLSSLYVWLAQKVGLDCVIQFNQGIPVIKNIQREDTGENLFKLTELDKYIGGHEWVCVFLSNNEVILVDPSTNLVTDNHVERKIVEEAGYKQAVYLDINTNNHIGLYGYPGNNSHLISRPFQKGEIDIYLRHDDMQETGGMFGKPVKPPKIESFSAKNVEITIKPMDNSRYLINFDKN